MEATDLLTHVLEDHPFVLVTKGGPGIGLCGCSMAALDVLEEYALDFEVLHGPAAVGLSEAAVARAGGGALPRLFRRGEAMAGADELKELHAVGELAAVLGVPRRPDPEPAVSLTEAAALALAERSTHVRVSIDRSYQHGLDADPDGGARPGDLEVEIGPVCLRLDRASARRADGLKIDWVAQDGMSGFVMENPNGRPRVRQLSAEQLRAFFDGGKPVEVFDVRTVGERSTARIEGTVLLDEEGLDRLSVLERETPVVFYCHHGIRSQAAAEHCLSLGFREVYNLAGGIDAWSTEVDPSVPRY